jgi:hypothetical protein
MQPYSNAHAAARGANPPADGREWVVLLSPDTRRMMSTPEVQAEVSAGTLARETLVWRAGMNEWLAIASIRELDVPVARSQRPASVAASHYNAEHHNADHYNASHQHERHGHAPPHRGHRPASSAEMMQELVTTGAVALIMVAITLYMLSLGGAFAAGGGQHASSAAHGAQASNASASAKTH